MRHTESTDRGNDEHASAVGPMSQPAALKTKAGVAASRVPMLEVARDIPGTPGQTISVGLARAGLRGTGVLVLEARAADQPERRLAYFYCPIEALGPIRAALDEAGREALRLGWLP